MKLKIFILMAFLMIASVYGANTIWTSSNDATTQNQNNPIVLGNSLTNIWTTYNISSCPMVYQPLVFDIDDDGTSDIIVFCGHKLKIYDYQANLQAEKIVGDLQGSPAIAIKDDLKYNIVAVVNNSANVDNLTYFDFNGTDIYINRTFYASLKGNGTATFCPVANNDCYSHQEGIVEATFSGTDYFCRYLSGKIVCYSNPDLTGTIGLNITTGLSCSDEYKIYVTNWDGGDDEILFSCGNLPTNTQTLKYYSSSGATIWTNTLTSCSAFNSFIDYDTDSFCTHSQCSPNNLKTYCWNKDNIATHSNNRAGAYVSKDGGAGIINNIVLADYNNDGFKDVYSHAGIFNLKNYTGLLRDYDTYFGADITNTEVLDLNLDGSLDFIQNTGSKIILNINGYTNQPPTITQLSYSTGNPVCLGSSITYLVYFEDTEEDWGRVSVDKYGNGNYTPYGDESGFPFQSVQYNQLGTYTSVIKLKDESNNVVNITHGVIVQTSNCYTSGQGGDTTTESTTGETTDIGGFIIKDGDKDGYTPSNSLYNSNNSIYFDASQCVELYGENWRRMIIPCPIRLLVKQGLNEIQAWVIGSFILVIIAVIIFFGYMMYKIKK